MLSALASFPQGHHDPAAPGADLGPVPVPGGGAGQPPTDQAKGTPPPPPPPHKPRPYITVGGRFLMCNFEIF